MTLSNYQRAFLGLLLVASVLILAGIGLRDPWPADEPRFAEVAREMVVTGDWLLPKRGGELYPDKPPVFMWAIALFYTLTGSLNLAFMLPSALAGVLVVMLVFDLGARIGDVRKGLLAAGLLMATPQFLLQAKTAQIDMLVCAWITLGCYGLLRHFFIGRSWPWYYAAWGFMGVGVITKGVGFLPALMMLPILVLAWRQPGLFQGRLGWRAALGPLFLLLPIALWGIPMLMTVAQSTDPDLVAYRDNLLLTQTRDRYLKGAGGHPQPWYYFLLHVIPALWFPLWLLVLARWRKITEALRQRPVMVALAGYVVLVLVFFSLAAGKRGVYILPALPMLALLVGMVSDRLRQAPWFEAVLKVTLVLFTLLWLVASGLALAEHRSITRVLDPPFWDLALVVGAIGVIWLVGLLWQGRRPALGLWGGLLAITWLIYSLALAPLLNPHRTPEKIMAAVADTVGPTGQLGLVKFKEQFILFSPIPVTHFGYLSEPEEQSKNAWQWMQERPDRYLLVPESTELACIDLSRATLIGHEHRRNWLLVNKAALTPHCPAPETERRYVSPSPWLRD